MKIVSFGDSFIFGSELQDNFDGDKSWVGLAAKQLGADYQTFGVPGCGNDHICRQIYSYFSKNTTKDTLAVINWTWASRWDFYHLGEDKVNATSRVQISEKYYNSMAGDSWPSYQDFINGIILADPRLTNEINTFVKSTVLTVPGKWFTLGPTCAPEKLVWMNNDAQALEILNFYNNHMQTSVLWNNFRSLQSINSAQSYLKQKNITAIQTFMDYELFSTDPNLVDDYIIELQNQVRPNLSFFDQELNFLDWAKKLGFKITPAPYDHPLEDAHQAACNLWLERYRVKLFG